MQQSVEKSAKAFGLMLGILKVNEVKSISHRSVYALLLGMESFNGQLAESINWLNASNDPAVEKLRSFGFDLILKKLAPLVPSAEKLKTDNDKIYKLNEAEMWQATLNLDKRNSYVKTSLKTLEKVPFDKIGFLFSMRVIKGVGKAFSGDIRGDYQFCILRSSPRAYGLSMLTMWHETSTRYPPINSKDYWNMGQYTRDKPLIKRFPFLLKHAKIFCENVYGAALVSNKLNQVNFKEYESGSLKAS